MTLLQAVRAMHEHKFYINNHDGPASRIETGEARKGMYRVRLIGCPDSLQYFCFSLEDAVDAGISMRKTETQLAKWRQAA